MAQKVDRCRSVLRCIEMGRQSTSNISNVSTLGTLFASAEEKVPR